jgi:signal transduction histidine kinase/CheY-like chemotaxis protein
VIAWNRAMELMTGIKAEAMLGKGNFEYSLPFYGERRPILIDLVLHPDLELEKLYAGIQRKGDGISGEAFTTALAPGNVRVSATASILRDSKGEIVGAIECIRDNTDRRNMEERLQRAEKMESLGILAGGVAHDLNNVLGVLVGYSELLLREVSEESLTKRYAQNILQGGERAAAIIQDLLTMARRGVSISQTVNLNQIVADAFKTPEFERVKSCHPDILFRSQVEKDLLNIKGSTVHLSKMLMNLLSNAAEAIEGAGSVTVRTENRYVDVPIPGYENTKEGEYAVLIVTDTGMGISPADLGRIFEPFYTKKVMGQSGTGLGLAVVWGTVKDHGGYIDVQTEEKKGSTFTLYFPVTRDALSKSDLAVSESEYQGSEEHILIVDDVEAQRSLAKTILEGLNYRMATVASGEEAVEYLKANPVDLVVLDMIMDPGIDGLETYRRILEVRPQQKAIIVSGFAKTERVGKTQELGAGEYVMKPYVIEKIGMAVRRELDKN